MAGEEGEKAKKKYLVQQFDNILDRSVGIVVAAAVVVVSTAY